jgi:hypothetical protein
VSTTLLTKLGGMSRRKLISATTFDLSRTLRFLNYDS